MVVRINTIIGGNLDLPGTVVIEDVPMRPIVPSGAVSRFGERAIGVDHVDADFLERIDIGIRTVGRIADKYPAVVNTVGVFIDGNAPDFPDLIGDVRVRAGLRPIIVTGRAGSDAD